MNKILLINLLLYLFIITKYIYFRFELPFNIWCLGCERHLARGVRFNAEKKQIGKYYTTPIFSFRMKCPSCSGWIEIHTDPKNCEYEVFSGGKRKNEEFKKEDNEIGGTRLSEEESEKLKSNPFFQLEHEARDTKRAQEQLPRLKALQLAKDSVYKDDWESSQSVRKLFCEDRKKIEKGQRMEEDFKRRNGLGGSMLKLKLLPEHPDDRATAKAIDFSTNRKKTKIPEIPLKGLEDDPKTFQLKKIIKRRD